MWQTILIKLWVFRHSEQLKMRKSKIKPPNFLHIFLWWWNERDFVHRWHIDTRWPVMSSVADTVGHSLVLLRTQRTVISTVSDTPPPGPCEAVSRPGSVCRVSPRLAILASWQHCVGWPPSPQLLTDFHTANTLVTTVHRDICVSFAWHLLTSTNIECCCSDKNAALI